MSTENPFAGQKWPSRLTLEWLVENKMPIYVRNITRPRGQLAVNFPKVHGGVKVEKIPRTHLPVRLNDRMSYDTILAADDLRQCIYKGVLDLVRPDVAWKELQDPSNQEETDRMQLSAFSARNTFVSERVQDMEKTVENRVDPNAPSLSPLGIETNIINPRIMRFVEQLKNGDISIKAAISELKTMETELTDKDCSYIIANGPDGQIRSHVQKVLASIQGQGIQEYSVDDSDTVNMTPEERAEEARREAAARADQAV